MDSEGFVYDAEVNPTNDSTDNHHLKLGKSPNGNPVTGSPRARRTRYIARVASSVSYLVESPEEFDIRYLTLR